MAASTITAVSAGTTQTTGRSLDDWGARRIGLFRFTPSTSYPSGGEPFDPRSAGFDMPVAAVFTSPHTTNAVSTLLRWEYDATNKKLKAIVTSTGVDTANATDLSTAVVDVLVIAE